MIIIPSVLSYFKRLQITDEVHQMDDEMDNVVVVVVQRLTLVVEVHFHAHVSIALENSQVVASRSNK